MNTYAGVLGPISSCYWLRVTSQLRYTQISSCKKSPFFSYLEFLSFRALHSRRCAPLSSTTDSMDSGMTVTVSGTRLSGMITVSAHASSSNFLASFSGGVSSAKLGNLSVRNFLCRFPSPSSRPKINSSKMSFLHDLFSTVLRSPGKNHVIACISIHFTGTLPKRPPLHSLCRSTCITHKFPLALEQIFIIFNIM